jgi:hypothetical protein
MFQSFESPMELLEMKLVIASQVKKLDLQTMELEETKRMVADLKKHIEVQQ